MPIAPTAWDFTRDYHSFANTDQVQVTHLSLTLTVDFEARTLLGEAVLSLRYIESQVAELWLDTRGLAILSVMTEAQVPLEFSLEESNEILGQKLSIRLPQLQCERVCIRYLTS
ncbi:MAG: aminopeptidase, partial [Shewanella sp.]